MALLFRSDDLHSHLLGIIIGACELVDASSCVGGRSLDVRTQREIHQRTTGYTQNNNWKVVSGLLKDVWGHI